MPFAAPAECRSVPKTSITIWFIEGIQCHRCAESLSEKSRSRARERQHQIELAQKSGMAHLGDQATEDSKKRRAYKNFKKRKERAASKLKAS